MFIRSAHGVGLTRQRVHLLIRLHRLCLSTPSVEVQGCFTQLTYRFLSLLEKEEGEFQRTRYYTSALSVSPRVLVDAVLTETGKSPSAWIRDRTMLEARRLLIYTDVAFYYAEKAWSAQEIQYWPVQSIGSKLCGTEISRAAFSRASEIAESSKRHLSDL